MSFSRSEFTLLVLRRYCQTLIFGVTKSLKLEIPENTLKLFQDKRLHRGESVYS